MEILIGKDRLLEMSTTFRHNELTSAFNASLARDFWDLIISKKMFKFQESIGLAYETNPLSLIDVSGGNYEEIDAEFLHLSEYIQPDFMLFHENKCAKFDDIKTVAGCPDLIVEVWSKTNTKKHRNFKFTIYSSSPTTEHWYLEQDSNIVECYLGQTQLPKQDISQTLVTTRNLQFDLTYLAL